MLTRGSEDSGWLAIAIMTVPGFDTTPVLLLYFPDTDDFE